MYVCVLLLQSVLIPLKTKLLYPPQRRKSHLPKHESTELTHTAENSKLSRHAKLMIRNTNIVPRDKKRISKEKTILCELQIQRLHFLFYYKTEIWRTWQRSVIEIF